VTAFISGPLDSSYDVASFACGVDSLDSWLANQALRAHVAGVSRVTVWAPREQPNLVAAFYSVSPTQVITRDEGLPRSATGGYSIIPAWLLGRLAVAEQFQKLGVGRQVLLDAVETIASAASRVGGRLIVVDPINDRASEWYTSFGFTPFGSGTGGRPPRMFLRIDRIIVSLKS